MAFTRLTTESNIIQSLPTKPTLSAAELKAKFDEYGDDVHDFLDDHIDELEADGAKNIGIEAITGITGTTVQGALEELTTMAQQSAAGVVSDGSITTAKLADGAVTTAKITDAAVTEAKIYDGSVSAAKLAASAVETAKINDGAVTEAKLAGTAVTTAKLGQSAVTTEKIANGAVTAAKTAFLPSTYYGDSLPGSGSEGQIFFLKV